MIDQNFTKMIARWLQGDHTSNEAIAEGAMLLLRLNRDQSMYQRIMRRPQREQKFLVYKLQRFLNMRNDGQTVKDVVKLDQAIMPEIKMAVTTDKMMSDVGKLPVVKLADSDSTTSSVVRKGIRPDHDRLPDNIKAIWTKNAERWKKIKEAYEACKQLTEPCDRYEYLKVLKEAWYKYKEDMARYDDYRLTEDGGIDENNGDDHTPVLTPEQEKELKNADSYISKNLPSLQQLVTTAKEEECGEKELKALDSLRQRIQQRVDVLLKCGRTLTDERRKQILQCDIKVTLEKPDVYEQGQESE